ncbi:transcriptional repressor [Candidatus Kuenenbacteria bacterium]|nr:transcriptional repressor [Candidatus Kuenenbacteria bacterium]
MPQFQSKPRTTNQRQVIFDYIKTTSLSHPTAEVIFESVRKKLPRISFGTVYRNLLVLEDQGLIIPLYYTKDHVRYDAIMENHYHFICQRCDKVENISMEEMLELNKQIAKRHELQIDYHRIYFYGLCGDCKKV